MFGAFLFGACLPRDDRLLRSLIERLEHLAIIVLMPIFFALAGLSTTGDAFVGAGLGALGLILAAAVLGKIIGGAAGARMGGFAWRDSAGRGLADERTGADGAGYWRARSRAGRRRRAAGRSRRRYRRCRR